LFGWGVKPQLLGHALLGAGRELDFVSFHRQEAAAPVRVTPRYRRRGACKTGRQGKHKSEFYNILGESGQTARSRQWATFSKTCCLIQSSRYRAV